MPPWPGLLVGGSNPGAMAWKDDSNDYQVNEVAINWVAAFIYATAALTPGALAALRDRDILFGDD